MRDKTENSQEGSSKANAVEKIEMPAKSNKKKPCRNFNKSKKKIKGHFFCVENRVTMPRIVGTENKTTSSPK